MLAGVALHIVPRVPRRAGYVTEIRPATMTPPACMWVLTHRSEVRALTRCALDLGTYVSLASTCSASHVYDPPLTAPALADTGKLMRILLLWRPGSGV